MDFDKIRRQFDQTTVSGSIAGIAAAITNGDEAIFEATAGVTSIGGATAITPDTLFWIASMTKPITSVAAMQLVEAGKLHLDAPIGDLLPELANPQILEGGRLRPAVQKITLRHLLTHTAGFSYIFASAELAAYAAANNITIVPGTLASLNAPLLFEPGTRWEYGISTDWVGRAVEAASGETLDAYFRNHITGPLGMNNTTFLPDDAQLASRTAMHKRQPDGSLTATQPSPVKRPEFFGGGGGLYSTLNDYQRFLRMFLNNGAGIISPASLAALSVNQIGPLRAGLMPSADAAFTTSADVYPGQDAKWSFGFIINPKTGPFGRSPGSLAWAGVANTHFWIDPARGIAAILLMQLLPAGDRTAILTLAGFEKAIYAALR